MNILVVNDDGIKAPGIQVLAHTLAKEHTVYIVAPATEQSGMSQALTMHRDILVHSVSLNLGEQEAFAVEGTPADCTKLALETILLDKNIELVVSGINKGYNLGTDLLYSGTVGAALEGYNHRVSSIAVSAAENTELSHEFMAAEILKKLPELISISGVSAYNINFPRKLAQNKVDFILTKQGFRTYANEYEVEEINSSLKAYRMRGKAQNVNNDASTDIETVNCGKISVTPILGDRTDYNRI